jgi:hypothetical protein
VTHVIATIEQVTPTWLTAVLKQQQALPQGEVLAIEQQPHKAAFNSITVHLKAMFSAGSELVPSSGYSRH